MLTKVYRCGPGRQALAKGYVVHGDAADSVVANVVAPGSPVVRFAESLGCVVRRAENAKTGLQIDTGLRWLLDADSRRLCQDQLLGVYQELDAFVRKSGGTLLPNAVRLKRETPWRETAVGDEHRFEIRDPVEHEVFVNLVRQELPALTGRAGFGPRGVEDTGSRRLLDSRHHLTARYFATVSPRHLSHLRRYLLRAEGVRRLDRLDVDPSVDLAATENGEGCNAVRLRFVDGQVMIETAIAHALLFQALFIEARERARAGGRIGNPPQRKIERNRAAVVAHGLRGRIAIDAGPTPRGKGKRLGNTRREPQWVPARDVILALIERLEYGFQVLETTWEELAPLVLGTSLRSMGVLAAQNESDLLRWEAANCVGPIDPHRVLDALAHAKSDQHPLLAHQVGRFPAKVEEVRSIWEGFLDVNAAISRNTSGRGNKFGEKRRSGKRGRGDRQGPPGGSPSSRPSRHGGRDRSPRLNSLDRSGPASGSDEPRGRSTRGPGGPQ